MKRNRVILNQFKRQRPLTYRIYDFLKKEAVGYENRVKASVLMQEFDIRDNKTLRAYIEEIRDSDILDKIICSEAGSSGGYWVATSQDEVYQTLQHLYKRSMKMLKTYSKIKNKSRLNNQYKIRLGQYEKDIYSSLMEVKNDSEKRF
jgi:hypothetical protein|nr:MAG TPA: hypothetical protein [Caudoviricetes sp.]